MTTPTTGLDGLRERAENLIAGNERTIAELRTRGYDKAAETAERDTQVIRDLLTALSAAPQGAEAKQARYAERMARLLEEHGHAAPYADGAILLAAYRSEFPRYPNLAAAPTPPAAAPAQDAATGGELPPCPFCGSADIAPAGLCFQCQSCGAMAAHKAGWCTRAAPDAREGLVKEAFLARARRIGGVIPQNEREVIFVEIINGLLPLAALPAAPEVRG